MMPDDNRQPAQPPYLNTPPVGLSQPPAPPYQNYNQSPAFTEQPDLAQKYIKPRKRWVFLLLFVVFVAIVGAGAWFGLRMYRNNPATIFNQAVGVSLHTKQVKQNFTSSTSTLTSQFDVNDIKKPRVSTLTTASLGVNVYVKGYGNLQNTYLSYANGPGSANTPPALLDQWIQVRDGGQLPNGLTLNPLLTASDPRYALLSPWVFGNFTGKERGSIAGQARKLYQLDSKHTQTSTLAGRQVLICTVTVNTAKLGEYFEKVGQAFGIPSSDSNAAAKLYGTHVSLKVYIQKDTYQVMRIDMTNDGVTSTITYDYRAASFPNEPNPSLTYDDYLKQLGS
ncbi:MAG TPA: hypothetical protein VJR27_00520 [Candidatus Saccharimonadales bacterium]|nr:hypothetical protein [Candidatus Saccharimonadales bacterium]